jgi:predicted ABC-type transport system involved in lysophospholipase L1 biosynthesis ATPase subunit
VERGLSLLIVTHDIAVGRATDRIVQMRDGAIVADEPAPAPVAGRTLAGRV